MKKNIRTTCILCHKLRIVTIYDKLTAEELFEIRNKYICSDHEKPSPPAEEIDSGDRTDAFRND